MKELTKLIGVLTAICVVAGLLLAMVSGLTAEPIAAALRQEKLRALKAVLPEYDNDPVAEAVKAGVAGTEWEFFIARKDDAFVGAACEVTTPDGYGGDIKLMVGLRSDGNTHGIAILQQKETPGLGAKIANPEFKDQFADRSMDNTCWQVGKDGGDIDQITAATISSRAVAAAVETAIDAYEEHAERIRQ